MKRLAIDIARKHIGQYVDCYRRMFGYYPLKIIEVNGIPHLKDITGTCMQIPESETDFNCHHYDYIFSLDASEEIARLRSQLAEVQRERDAAVADMKAIVDNVREEHGDETCCFACAYDCDTSITDSGAHACECPGFERDDCFKWRGKEHDNA